MAATTLPGLTGKPHDRPAQLVPPSVVPVSGDDLPTLAATAVAATADTPTTRWLVPDPRQRPAVLHAWYQLLLEQALTHGRVDAPADRSAVAVWFDRTKPVPDLHGSLGRLTASCGKHAITLLGYHHLLHQHQPRSAHLNLTLLAGADPAVMAGLLAYRHRSLDPAGVPSYAVADSPARRDLLITAGYQPSQPFCLAAGVQLWPMRRPAAALRPGTRPTASVRA